MDQHRLLERITVNPEIFGGKPIIRGRRLAVEIIEILMQDPSLGDLFGLARSTIKQVT